MKTAYVATVISRAFTRPMRSATTPATAPPIAETTSGTVVRPVWPLSSPKYAASATMLSGSVKWSNESSA